MQSPYLICIAGLTGTGKTTTARELIKHLPNTILIDPDVTRAELEGRCSSTIFTEKNRNAEIVTKTILLMVEKTKVALKEGKNVVVPSSMRAVKSRKQFEILAQEQGVAFLGYWLEVPFDVALERAQARADGTQISEFHNASKMLPSLERPVEEPMTWKAIDATGDTATIVKSLYEDITRPDQEGMVLTKEDL